MKIDIKKSIIFGLVIIAALSVILFYRSSNRKNYIKGQEVFSDDLKNKVLKISFWMNDECYTTADQSQINEIFDFLSGVELTKKSGESREQKEGGYNLELYTEEGKMSLDVSDSELIFDNVAYGTDQSVDKELYQIFFGKAPE